MKSIFSPALFGLALSVVLASSATAQNRQPSIPTAIPQAGPPQSAPAKRESIRDFVDSVQGTEAALEVIVGQGKLLTLREPLASTEEGGATIAVGDPSVLEFEVIGLKQIRLIGQTIGTTDLSVTTGDDHTYSFEVRVIADLRTLQARLRAFYPDSSVKVSQISDHIVVEGQGRSKAQIDQIMQTVSAWLISLQAAQARRIAGDQQAAELDGPGSRPNEEEETLTPSRPELQITSTIPQSQIVNLMTVPGSQQVMLKVQIAELNRTGLRRMGASFLHTDGSSFTATSPSGPGFGFGGTGTGTGSGMGSLLPILTGAGSNTTVAGLIAEGSGSFVYFLEALRRNSVLKILAEPTLVAYDGHEATFLAGGEFPVPVPQNTGGVGVGTVTIEFREFGVRLGFLPNIMEDDRIRLTVSPEVSSIDRSLSTSLGGTEVPGLNIRKSNTTVEMKSGQTLAMAGLLQVTLDNTTNRIPGLGDLPILGPFFSNTTGEREEKELVVMVTPFLVEPMESSDVCMLPGQEVNEPNDLEFYLLGRIEGRTGNDFRSTTKWDDPLGCVRKMKLHKKYVCGPSGYSH